MSEQLQFDTASFSEQEQGILVCGVSWGGDPAQTLADPHREKYQRSFFSDCSEWVMNDCPYRTRVLSWMSHLGLHLETTPARAGRLERSISQVNWLPSQTVDTRKIDVLSACIAEHEFFFRHLAAIRPSVVLFLSTTLLLALNSRQCLPLAEGILGPAKTADYQCRNYIRQNGRLHPRLKVGMQAFAHAMVIALPHPAYKGGIEDEYISMFHDWIGPVLRNHLPE